MTLKPLLSILLVSSFLFIAACQEKGPAEKAGEAIDNAADDIGDAAEDAADEMEDAVDN